MDMVVGGRGGGGQPTGIAKQASDVLAQTNKLQGSDKPGRI